MSDLNDWKKIYRNNSNQEWRVIVVERENTIRKLKAENAALRKELEDIKSGSDLYELLNENTELQIKKVRLEKCIKDIITAARISDEDGIAMLEDLSNAIERAGEYVEGNGR